MPGATPLRADARRNRDRVLDVARTAFAADGLSVPLDEIVDEGAALRDSSDPGTAFFGFIDRLAAEAGPKRDLLDALASVGVEVGAAVKAAADDLRAAIADLLDQARHAGTVRADIGTADLMALLSGILFALRPRPGANHGLVFSVFREGMRPQARSHGE